MSYDNERIAKTLLERLEANLPGQLDVVEALWVTEGDPVTLPDPVTYFRGHKPTVLGEDSTYFPFVAVLIMSRSPQGAPLRWGYQESNMPAFVDFFVVADDEDTVNKIASRYGEAIVLALQEERYVAGYKQDDWEPLVSISEASRHPKTAAQADMFDDADVDFIQGGRVEIGFEGG